MSKSGVDRQSSIDDRPARCVVCGRDEAAMMSRKIAWFSTDICMPCALGMKATCLYQPWAGFIAMGEKTIETRFWKTTCRGPLLICSALKVDDLWRKVSSRPNADPGAHLSRKMRGVALCVATLADCRPMVKGDEDAAMVRFEPGAGRYSWVLADIRPVTPFAVIGQQRVFQVTPAILRERPNSKN